MYEEFMHEEAVDWLETNFNPSALASGRFGSTAEALEFVRRLYEAGAKKVSVIDADDSRLFTEGGPYSDTLAAALPEDAEKRAAVTAIYMEEVSARGCNGGDAGSSRKNNVLVFSWE
jgi:fructoselysine-6-P-deglycase FrlB-like protein